MSEYLIIHIFPDQSEHLKNLLEALKDMITLSAHSHIHKNCHSVALFFTLSNECEVLTDDSYEDTVVSKR